MNNEKNKLDKLFREKLQSYKFEANDADWNAMEDLLNKRRRTGFWSWLYKNRFVLTVGLIALIATTTIFMISGDEKKEIAKVENATTEETGVTKNENNESSFHDSTIDKENQNNRSSIKIANDEIIVEEAGAKTVNAASSTSNGLNDEAIVVSNEKILAQSTNNEANSTSDNFKKNNANTVFENNVNEQKSSMSKLNSHESGSVVEDGEMNNSVQSEIKNAIELPGEQIDESAQKSKSAIDETDLTMNQGEMNNANSNSNDESLSGSLDNYQERTKQPDIAESANKGMVLDTSKGAANSIPSESANKNDVVSNNTDGNSMTQNRIAQEGNPVSNEKKSATKNPMDELLTKPNSTTEQVQKISNHKIYLGLNASSAFVSKKLDATHPLSNEYLSRRENEESNSLNFHGGLSATVQFNQLMLSTGFDYSTYSEKIEYQPISKFVVIDSSFVLDSTPTGGGNLFDTIWTVGLNVVDSLNYSVSSKNRKTKWTYIEIPLMVWYRMEKEKLLIDGGVGGSIGMLQKVEAYYLNTKLNDLENVDTEGNYKDIVYNAMLSARVHYKIDKNWLVGLDFRYKQNISSIFKSEYSVDQKYRSFNAGLSIMYLLNTK